ncbi:hypothetical protein DUI87_06920 [Hirundo rustica rustica]|uniref:Uncharacterized protein n=1 Tax=Hirundo rustica rustica TaxID=333673 RepID=A0A3M0KNX3_HIRRU|nr:hypothetical protein DUI87_06920 [Hirundo rustica rustica]
MPSGTRCDPWSCPVLGQELDSMIPMGPFPLRYSVNLLAPQGQKLQDLEYFLWMFFIPQTSTRGISGHLTQHQVTFAETTELPLADAGVYWRTFQVLHCRDGDSTTSLGSPFQCLTTLSVKKFFLMPNMNLLWRSLRPCPHILLLAAWEKRPSLTWLQPLVREF